VLGQRAFATIRQGYRALLKWMAGFGRVEKVGVEQSGSCGAGVVRHMALDGIAVLEITGPDKADRRARGKDDMIDAVAAAQAALTGKRISVAQRRDGRIEALRVLRATRQTAVKARRVALHTCAAGLNGSLSERMCHRRRSRRSARRRPWRGWTCRGGA
jgi:transposase